MTWRCKETGQQQSYCCPCPQMITKVLLISPWCRIYASVNRVKIGSDNGLSPDRRQAIIWTNTRILSIGPFRTKFSDIRIKIQNFSFTKMHLKMSGKWRPFCPGGSWTLNVLILCGYPAFIDVGWKVHDGDECLCLLYKHRSMKTKNDCWILLSFTIRL